MFVAQIAERRSEEARRLRVVQIVETLARSVKLEMDFRLEAAAAAEFAANAAADDDFRVPSIDWDRTAKHVLTTEWIDGIALSDVPALHAAGMDTRNLARIVIQSFLRHAMRDGFFHADMHQGNLFADAKGRLVAVDFGIMGRLGAKEQRFLAEILFGFITRDYMRVARVHFDAGYVPPHHSVEEFAQAIRAIGEPIHARRADEISMAKLFTLLFEVTSLFDMRTRPELVLLQKTMVVVEGVARDLDPHLDIWKTAEPVVRRWIEDNLGPAGQVKHATAGLGEALQAAARMPALLARAELLADRLDRLTEEGIAIAPSAMRGIEKAQARAARFGHWALWLLAAAVVVLIFR
jgi:ubiquinone biosynthesis protein